MDFDKNDIRKYKSIKTTLRLEKEELQHMQPEIVADTYKDYKSGYPVIKKVEGIEGCDSYQKRYYLKEKKIARLTAKLAAIEEYVDNMEDHDLQNIFKLVFIRGYTQKRAARAMGPGWTRAAVQKRIERFFAEK